MSKESFPNDRTLFAGFRLGLLIGATVTFFRGPRYYLPEKLGGATDSLRDTIESVTPSDPIEESIAEGKEAARRRRSELGLDER
jgi:hypothetical protein